MSSGSRWREDHVQGSKAHAGSSVGYVEHHVASTGEANEAGEAGQGF